VRIRANQVLILVVIVLVAAAPPARAENWEVTPFLGYRTGGNVTEIESGNQVDFDVTPTWGVSLGRWISPETRIEGTWSHQLTDLEGYAFGVNIDHLHVAGVYEPVPKGKAGGYVLASAGVTNFNPSASGAGSDTRLSGSVGGGGRFRLSPRMSLRAEARLWAVLTSANAAVFCDQGCVFAFSGGGMLQFELSLGLAIAF
jgi:hypothetical protein